MQSAGRQRRPEMETPTEQRAAPRAERMAKETGDALKRLNEHRSARLIRYLGLETPLETRPAPGARLQSRPVAEKKGERRIEE